MDETVLLVIIFSALGMIVGWMSCHIWMTRNKEKKEVFEEEELKDDDEDNDYVEVPVVSEGEAGAVTESDVIQEVVQDDSK